MNNVVVKTEWVETWSDGYTHLMADYDTAVKEKAKLRCVHFQRANSQVSHFLAYNCI